MSDASLPIGAFGAARQAVRSACRTLAIGFGTVALGGCGVSPTVHYLISVDINDAGQQRSGSSVWSFALSKGLLGPYVPRFDGEAVAIDLGAKGTLFALLVGRNAAGWPDPGTLEMLPERLFGDVGRMMRGQAKLHDDRAADLAAVSARVGARATLNCTVDGPGRDPCPFLVRFRDPGDSKTIEPVDPADLAATFGPGVTLRRITVTIVAERGKAAIAPRLPDYGPASGFDQWYRNLAFDDPRRMTRDAFIAESQ